MLRFTRNNNDNTLLHKNTRHVHVLGLEGHIHDTNTSLKTTVLQRREYL